MAAAEVPLRPMSPRLAATLSQARVRPLLCCGIVAGDPHIDATSEQMLAVARGGADLIEIIYPFSNPSVHGPVIQRACQRALREGVSFEQLVEQCALFREQSQVPLIVSSYMNRVLAEGEQTFLSGIAQAGCDALLVNDLPWLLSASLRHASAEAKILPVCALAPTTPPERVAQMVSQGGLGLWTGSLGGELVADEEAFAALSQLTAALPQRFALLASRQVSDAADAGAIASLAHGVAVTSALVWIIEGRGAGLNARLESFVSELRGALDQR